MEDIKRFIEDAIKGGWKEDFDKHRVNDDYGSRNIEAILLDPLAWQAVGKTRGWPTFENMKGCYQYMNDQMCSDNAWRVRWHTFIEELSIGKSIEESLKALE